MQHEQVVENQETASDRPALHYSDLASQVRIRANLTRGNALVALIAIAILVGVTGWQYIAEGRLSGAQLALVDMEQAARERRNEAHKVVHAVRNTQLQTEETRQIQLELLAKLRDAEARAGIKTSKAVIEGEKRCQRPAQELISLDTLPPDQEPIKGIPTQALVIERTILRSSMLALNFFLLYILAAGLRYFVRVASHLDAVADTIELCRSGDPATLKPVLEAMTPNVTFGKLPSTPIAAILRAAGRTKEE